MLRQCRRLTHYERLGVSTIASRADIKKVVFIWRWSQSDLTQKAYRQKAIDAHPDRFPEKHAEFASINSAKEILLDTAKRRDYDATLQLSLNDQNEEVRQSRRQVHWHRSAGYQRPVYDEANEDENNDEDDFFAVLNNERQSDHETAKPLKFVVKKKPWFWTVINWEI